jgi:hypothetical protein
MPKHHPAGDDRRVIAMRTELARKISARAPSEGDTLTEVPGLTLYRRSAPNACTSAAYQPSLVVFVQGQKRINVGKTIYVSASRSFTSAKNLPTLGAWPSALHRSNFLTRAPVWWTPHPPKQVAICSPTKENLWRKSRE